MTLSIRIELQYHIRIPVGFQRARWPLSSSPPSCSSLVHFSPPCLSCRACERRTSILLLFPFHPRHGDQTTRKRTNERRSAGRIGTSMSPLHSWTIRQAPLGKPMSTIDCQRGGRRRGEGSERERESKGTDSTWREGEENKEKGGDRSIGWVGGWIITRSKPFDTTQRATVT